MVCYEIHYFLLSLLQAQNISKKKNLRKNMEEIKKELLELLFEERSEGAEVIHKPGNVLHLQDDLACMKQYEKHYQDEKQKVISNTYH